MQQRETQAAAHTDGPVSRSRSRHSKPDSFQRYMKKNYAEHFRRIKSWRRSARVVRYVYPIVSSIVFSIPFAVLWFVMERLYELQPEWFVKQVSLDSRPLIQTVLVGLLMVASLLGILTGVGLGISRARVLNFEAEKTELFVRQSYFLRRMARARHTKKTHLDF